MDATHTAADTIARIEGRRAPHIWRVVHEAGQLWLSTEPGQHFSIDTARATAAVAVLRQALRADASPRLEVESDSPSALETLFVDAGLPPALWRKRRPLPPLGLNAGDQIVDLSRRIPLALRLGMPVWLLAAAGLALGLGGTAVPPPASTTDASAAGIAVPSHGWLGQLNGISQRALPAGIAGFARIELLPTGLDHRREVRLVLTNAEAVPVLGDAKAPAAVSEMQRLEVLLTGLPGAVSSPRPLDIGRGYAITLELPAGTAPAAALPTAEALRATAQASGLVLQAQSTPEGLKVVGDRVPAALAIEWLAGLDRGAPMPWRSLSFQRVTEHQGEPLPEGLVRVEGLL